MSGKQITPSRRYADGLELRAKDGEEVRTVRAYAALFDSVYDMGRFTEEISRSAFDGADMSDVRVLKNHDPNLILGRNAAGTARVGVDERGFWYEVDLPDSPDGENMRVSIQRKDITQSSWGFFIADEPGAISWEKRNGKSHAKINKVSRVIDASLVTFAANPDTYIEQALRSLEIFEQQDTADEPVPAARELEIRKRRLALAKTNIF